MSFKAKIEKKYQIKSHVPSAPTKPVTVTCLFKEIEDKAHSTHAPDTFYIDFGKLPKCVQDLFRKAKPIVDKSHYTVYAPIAYLRVNVITKDGAKLAMESHLGQLDESDEDSWEDTADEMKATFDWDKQDIYFEVDEYPEEGKDE